jgi:hypothetical protein
MQKTAVLKRVVARDRDRIVEISTRYFPRVDDQRQTAWWNVMGA